LNSHTSRKDPVVKLDQKKKVTDFSLGCASLEILLLAIGRCYLLIMGTYTHTHTHTERERERERKQQTRALQ
jgi:hypothetical protein